MAHLRAEITPKVLQWARKRSALDANTLAKRLGVSPDRYESWEMGEGQPTLKQLLRAAKILQRPLGFFFLPEPPDEPEILSEFRRLPNSQLAESHTLTEAVRKAKERRDVALELYDILDQEPPAFDLMISLDDDPDEVGIAVRDLLEISISEQASWRDAREALRSWKEALEIKGILVFQTPSISIREMRGFSLAERPLPVIAFNSADAIHGRIFTILHEFAHILLGDSTLDIETAGSSHYSGNARTEQFCNRVAAATLIPQGDLLGTSLVKALSPSGLWQDRDIQSLSSRYSVSKAVILRRLRHFDLISQSVYESLVEEYDTYVGSDAGEQNGGSYYNNVLAWMGTLIPRLAFAAYGEDRITSADLAAIFGSKIKNLGKFEERLNGYNLHFPA